MRTSLLEYFLDTCLTIAKCNSRFGEKRPEMGRPVVSAHLKYLLTPDDSLRRFGLMEGCCVSSRALDAHLDQYEPLDFF